VAGCEKDNGNSRSLRDNKQEEQATTGAGWQRFYVPPIAVRLAMDGPPDCFVAVRERATATAEADPCGMTTKK
jgi:hypothetical protein